MPSPHTAGTLTGKGTNEGDGVGVGTGVFTGRLVGVGFGVVTGAGDGEKVTIGLTIGRGDCPFCNSSNTNPGWSSAAPCPRANSN